LARLRRRVFRYDQSVEQKLKKKKPKFKGGAGSAGQRKLSFKDKFALESLPKEMDSLATQIATLKATLADSSFYARDPEGFTKATADLEAAEARVVQAEEEWLALEVLREEIECS